MFPFPLWQGYSRLLNAVDRFPLVGRGCCFFIRLFYGVQAKVCALHTNQDRYTIWPRRIDSKVPRISNRKRKCEGGETHRKQFIHFLLRTSIRIWPYPVGPLRFFYDMLSWFQRFFCYPYLRCRLLFLPVGYWPWQMHSFLNSSYVHRIRKRKMPFDRKWLDTISCTLPESLNEQKIPIYFICVNTVAMNHYLFYSFFEINIFFMVTIHVHSMTLIKRPISSQWNRRWDAC